MELGFNLLWLLVSAAMLVALWCGAVDVRRLSPWTVLQKSVLLIGVLFILFPSISVTDDLHTTELIYDTSGSSRKVRSSDANHALTDAPGTVPLLNQLAVRPTRSSESVFDSDHPSFGRVVVPAFAGRAPPSLTLL